MMIPYLSKKGNSLLIDIIQLIDLKKIDLEFTVRGSEAVLFESSVTQGKNSLRTVKN